MFGKTSGDFNEKKWTIADGLRPALYPIASQFLHQIFFVCSGHRLAQVRLQRGPG